MFSVLCDVIFIHYQKDSKDQKDFDEEDHESNHKSEDNSKPKKVDHFRVLKIVNLSKLLWR